MAVCSIVTGDKARLIGKTMANHDSVRQTLRSRTQELHEELDQHVLASEPFSTLENYHSFLFQMRQLHLTLEPASRKVGSRIGLPNDGTRIVEATQQDWSEIPEPLPIEPLRHLPAGDWGYAYVLEGSSFGAIQMHRLAKKSLPPGTSTEFLAAMSSRAGTRWVKFAEALEKQCSDVQSAVAAAQDAFTLAHAIFEVKTSKEQV